MKTGTQTAANTTTITTTKAPAAKMAKKAKVAKVGKATKAKAKKAKKPKTLRLTGIHYKPEVLELLEKFEEALDKVPKKLESLDDLQLKCDAVEAFDAYRTKYLKLKSARDTNVAELARACASIKGDLRYRERTSTHTLADLEMRKTAEELRERRAARRAPFESAPAPERRYDPGTQTSARAWRRSPGESNVAPKPVPQQAPRTKDAQTQRPEPPKKAAMKKAPRAKRDIVTKLGPAAKLMLRELEIATEARSGEDGVETDAYDSDAKAASSSTPRPLVRRRKRQRSI